MDSVACPSETCICGEPRIGIDNGRQYLKCGNVHEGPMIIKTCNADAFQVKINHSTPVHAVAEGTDTGNVNPPPQ